MDLAHFLRPERLPTILQSEATECGLACIAMVSHFHGLRIDLATLRSRYSISSKGSDLRSLISAAERLDLVARPLKTNLDAVKHVRLPAILHWDMNHFVVLKRVTAKYAEIVDPAIGRRRHSWKEVAEHYTGVVLELEPAKSFKPGSDFQRIGLSDLWSRMSGLKRSFVQLVTLTLLLQFFVLIAPLYLQLVVDKAMAEGDEYFLTALTLGFGLFAILSATTTLVRSYVLIYLSNIMSYQMIVNLFRHLVRLPQSYFDKRPIGDILSRFKSTQPIKNMLTEGLISTFVDGVLAVTTLIMMYLYSATLAFVSLAALSIHSLVISVIYRHLRSATQEAIIARANETTNFMETVRGMLTVKMYAKESERQAVWQNKLAKSVGADARTERNRIYMDFSEKLIFGLEGVSVIYLAAMLNIEGEITVGAIFAYLAYKVQFTEKSMALIRRIADFRMLSLHLLRLSDIVLADREDEGHVTTREHSITGEIHIKDLYYRYADSDPHILAGVELHIDAGEAVAIAGPSGVGKSTLAKVVVGLLEPTAGEILVDGRPIGSLGLKNFRMQIGAVMQDDKLFAGTIAENISFFDSEVDEQWIYECARLACIHDEIIEFPMQYRTMIGDMGSALSGGQVQRVMLARALYRRPKLLVLDEGTAHIDTANEERISERVRSFGMTRIIIAHRKETLAIADRVLTLQKGRIVSHSERLCS